MTPAEALKALIAEEVARGISGSETLTLLNDLGKIVDTGLSQWTEHTISRDFAELFADATKSGGWLGLARRPELSQPQLEKIRDHILRRDPQKQDIIMDDWVEALRVLGGRVGLRDDDIVTYILPRGGDIGELWDQKIRAIGLCEHVSERHLDLIFNTWKPQYGGLLVEASWALFLSMPSTGPRYWDKLLDRHPGKKWQANFWGALALCPAARTNPVWRGRMCSHIKAGDDIGANISRHLITIGESQGWPMGEMVLLYIDSFLPEPVYRHHALSVLTDKQKKAIPRSFLVKLIKHADKDIRLWGVGVAALQGQSPTR